MNYDPNLAWPEAEPTEVLPPPWQEFWLAPLWPLAVAAILGVLLSQTLALPFLVSVALVFFGASVAWFGHALPARRVGLAVAMVGLAAAHHRYTVTEFPPDDFANGLDENYQLRRVRGTLLEDPKARQRSSPRWTGGLVGSQLSVTLQCQQLLMTDASWQHCSGQVYLVVEEESGEASAPHLPFQAGDEVEVLGRFRRFRGPANPGERDLRLPEQAPHRRCEGLVSGVAAIVRLERGSSWNQPLATLRRELITLLESSQNRSSAAVARALLLGDGSAMLQENWHAYIRTGVVHVLAISGQHLAILAVFLGFLGRLFGIPARTTALVVLAVIIGYTIFTGWRPSGVRAAVMVSVACGAVLLRRRLHLANAFCLAVIIVLAFQPHDLFNLGCQLSFLAVFALLWGVRYWFHAPPTPLDRLIDETRPLWLRLLRRGVRFLALAYATNAILLLLLGPLLLASTNTVPLIGLMIGPIAVLLTTIGLIAGFVYLALGLVLGPLMVPLAWVLSATLQLCQWVVTLADAVPFGVLYWPAPPLVWTSVFYGGILLLILRGSNWQRTLSLALIWWMMAILWPTSKNPADELRLTLLSVGKGSCHVLECPDGRYLIYDVGSGQGPGFVRKSLAPFLWQRGVTRIDEVILSHADADHFNGLVELLKRFPVGTVTLTPTFSSKPTLDVAQCLTALEQQDVARRLAVVGDRFQAGDVKLEILHPPTTWREGTENERSMVVKLCFAGFTILFTGDLEKAGTQALLKLPPQPVDVLMAPHHGSRSALPKELLSWCSPRMILVSRGQPYGNTLRAGEVGSQLIWDTDTHGAITLRANVTGLTVESYRTGERVVFRRERTIR